MVTKADDELLQVAVKIEFHDVCGLFLLVARRRYNLQLLQLPVKRQQKRLTWSTLC